MTEPKDENERQARLIEFRYQLWTRLCEVADELMSIADAWYETDPDLIELHAHRAGFSLKPPEQEREQ